MLVAPQIEWSISSAPERRKVNLPTAHGMPYSILLNTEVILRATLPGLVNIPLPRRPVVESNPL
jgi:hypothetical protein